MTGCGNEHEQGRRPGKNIVVAVTGASGSIYARLVLEGLVASAEVARVGLIVSEHGAEVAAWERVELPQDPRIERFSNDDMFSSPASGSAPWDAMVVVPASMGCVGRIAAGVSSDLIARAADVMLKEGRTLVIVPRETPMNLIHLRNLVSLAGAGAVVLPASPSFYSRPESIEAVCATVSDRILARLGVGWGGYEWGK